MSNLPDLSRRPRSGLAVALDEVHDFFTRFVAFRRPEEADAIVLWTAHTHVVAEFTDYTPRLVIVSPDMESGKTRLLECLEVLCPRAVMTVNITGPALFRLMGTMPTVLHDEIDTVFGSGQKRDDLRVIINGGHSRGATIQRVDPDTGLLRFWPVFGAIALAGNELPPRTVVSRSIIITLLRRRRDQRLDPFRRRLTPIEARPICDHLRHWAKVQGPQLVDPRPLFPSGVTDRAADNWETLLAIAELAGDDWTGRGRQAAVHLTAETREQQPGERVELLRDIRTVMDDLMVDAISSADLVQALQSHSSQWATLDQRSLATKLRFFGVKPATIPKLTQDGREAKGYRRAWFVDLWERYLSG
jgi:hypothetical protein